MALRCDPARARERILLMGSWNSGKTYTLLKLAQRLQPSGKQLYIVDTDWAMDRMLEETGEFAGLDNVTYETIDTWPDYMRAMAKFHGSMTTDDWLAVDMIGPAWDLVQEYFTEMVFGSGIEEFFLKARQANEKGSPLDGYQDWSIINKLYRKSTKYLYKARGHVICTSMVEPVNYKADSKDIKNLFGPLGVKPKGQKHTAHLFHTVLLLSSRKPGDWRITTAKDRNRKPLEDVQVRDWPVQYLVGRAGWKP